MAGRRDACAVAEWAFSGRADELRRLRELVRRAERGGVVLAGPSGVGKTRLGVECLRLAERAGLATVRVTATRSAAELPFGALTPLLPGEDPPAGTVDDRADLLRRSAAALVERAGDRRLVVLVDDAHLLDGSSATLVHQLVAGGSAVVVATVTTGEPAPDPIAALWKDGLAERMDIGGLGSDAIAELLPVVLGGPVDPATSAALTDHCRGNVLYLRELVIGAVDDGSLVDEGGIWRLQRALSPSPRLVELVEARLGGLDDDERALLELVSYGEPVGQAELSALADPDVAERLERRALLTSRTDGRRLEVRLAHPLYGDVVRAQTPTLRQRRLAQSLAEVIETAGARRRDDALRIATWRLAGGGGRPDLLLAGASSARWRYDYPLAERLARAAAEAGAGFAADSLAAQLAGIQGRTEDAERELAALATRAGDDQQRARIAIARFDNSVVWTGQDALRILDEAERTITAPGWRDELAARRLAALSNTRGPQAVVEAAEGLLDRATGSALAFACMPAAHSLARCGRIHAALDTAARGLAAQRATSRPVTWYPWWHAVTRCSALRCAGHFHEAEAAAEAHYRDAVDVGSTEAQAVFATVLAQDVGERGRVQTAARRAQEAVVLHRQLGRPLLARIDHHCRALALALAGEADAAAAELAALDALGIPPLAQDEIDIVQARGWAAVAAGDLPRARDHFERAIERGESIGDLVGQASALHALARVGHASQASERLAAVAAQIEGELALARAAHVEALAHGDAAGLEKASRSFEAMGADLLAAEAAADGAVARRRAGEMRAAAAAERRTASLVERCEGPVTPALQAVEVRAQLTPAERETAVLAAGGRSNTAIADQLFLSRRTVENRLHRVYEKLGISGRDELAEALSPDTPP